MWYYLITLVYAIMIIVLLASNTNSIDVLKYMVAITYMVLPAFLCAVLDELERLKKVLKHDRNN
jgi:hypothetical protein